MTLLVIDAGNTRIKWAQVGQDGRLFAQQAAVYDKLEESSLKEAIALVDKVIISNVAGDAVQKQLQAIIPQDITTLFARPTAEACGVINSYQQLDTLGMDRWASVIAAWDINKQPSVVINAGTAITVDLITRDNRSRQGTYLGGSIMPGLQLMYRALADNTADLSNDVKGEYVAFPKKTADAIESGCINAIVGGVVLQLKLLEKQSAFLPKVLISGGDAVKIAEALSVQLKRIKIVDNLVLRGLAIIEKESL